MGNRLQVHHYGYTEVRKKTYQKKPLWEKNMIRNLGRYHGQMTHNARAQGPGVFVSGADKIVISALFADSIVRNTIFPLCISSCLHALRVIESVTLRSCDFMRTCAWQIVELWNTVLIFVLEAFYTTMLRPFYQQSKVHLCFFAFEAWKTIISVVVRCFK